MNYYRYKHIFFDLDHTLWDHERNSRETLSELFDTHQLTDFGLTCKQTFWQTFDTINRELWECREKDLLPVAELRNQRNAMLIERCGLASYKTEALSRLEVLNEDYLQQCPAKPHLLPYALDLLESLFGSYRLHILTNGFPEIQGVKLSASGIAQYFDLVVTPEEAGAPKPHATYFAYVLRQLQAKPHQCLMIGDNIDTDVLGALSQGIDCVYLNPADKKHNLPVTKEVSCLSELIVHVA